MKNTLLNKDTTGHIIQRINRLNVLAKPLWGEMSATEMLLHCNLCNMQILTEGRSNHKTTIKQFLLRIIAIYLAPDFKKNIKADERNDTKGKIDSGLFEKEKEKFVELINLFPKINKELTLTHPAFGNISTKEWGVAAFKHMDHHLRQFGV